MTTPFFFIVISPVVEILCSCNSYKVLYILIRFCKDIFQVRLCKEDSSCYVCFLVMSQQLISKTKSLYFFLLSPTKQVQGIQRDQHSVCPSIHPPVEPSCALLNF